ncbi:conserved hypothetical protein [Ricinus communis]|uniref:Uncharacterized protein n=1 Tax=Ricinus communis TaxID=3988 RepID=B9RJQ6_RICCO|nr:conserved hypothetical protein [Ricinus communis]
MDLPGLILSGLIFNGLIVAFSFLLILVRIAAENLRHNLPWWLRWDITLSAVTIAVESTAAALEQTSPHKLKTAEYGMLMAAISLLLGLADLAYKKYMQHRNRKADKDISHVYLQWDFADTFGLFSSILTLITAALNYHWLSSGKRQPLIQFSVMPLAFSVCIFCSCVLRRPVDQPTSIMRCRHLGPINLDVEYGGYGPTQLVRTVCQIGQMHPQEV